jgi:hypothetical protein
MIEIKEQFLEGKISPETCEDVIAVGDNYAAVIDGSTSKTPFRLNGVDKNGKLAANILRQAILDMPAEATAAEACKYLTSVVYRQYTRYDVVQRMLEHPEQRLTASVVIYSRHHCQIWMIGDCYAFVEGITYDNPKPPDERVAKMRSEYIRNQLFTGESTVEQLRDDDSGRRYILPFIVEGMRFQNDGTSADGYSVVDGFPIPLNKVRVIDVPASTEEVVLASDGYLKLFPTLEESEHYLYDYLASDPLLVNTHPCTKCFLKGQKSFDDRTYLRIKI